ncbi:uncharacterized protein JN550_009243 [Neoarthrinium moseri]|uniref:uncharacterized protein n=1 Tax=Neoarthrinium moseri TaxID=1658444 RepID=UPI001FDE3FE6|nr:uncharacterized protein JN550_009243 [Neoarthrinium moseri]KAI1863964.1 hypothetical protein JN550_009243 [Neoarthrinium moseri]
MPPKTPKRFPTHFLCIPLVTTSSRPQLASSLESFSADVTSADSFAIPAGAIRPVGTLHLTLGVMSFPKNEGLEKAVELLKTIVPRRIIANIKAAAPAKDGQEADGTPPPLLSVTLKGIHSMQSASKATTLYSAPEDPDGILQKFCEEVKKTFEEADVMENDKRPLLLHATIINTIYVKGRRQGKKHEKITIDARGILDRYDDYEWMRDVPVEKIAICRMGAKDVEDSDDKAYEVEAEIDVEGTE